jgi:hypothetical protein
MRRRRSIANASVKREAYFDTNLLLDALGQQEARANRAGTAGVGAVAVRKRQSKTETRNALVDDSMPLTTGRLSPRTGGQHFAEPVGR